MERSSRRAQTEPIAALAAVFAVTLGLALYVGVLDTELPGSRDPASAERALPAVESAIAPQGVAQPHRLDSGVGAGPKGYETNVTLRANGTTWTAGPVPPEDADRARRRIGVATRPAHVRAGTLEVTVWP